MARLGQIIKTLNIGIATAVDYLQKKGETIEQNPNLKLTDEQEALLMKEFRSDKNIKQESERLLQKRQEKEKVQSVAVEGYEKIEKPVVEEKKPVEQELKEEPVQVPVVESIPEPEVIPEPIVEPVVPPVVKVEIIESPVVEQEPEIAVIKTEPIVIPEVVVEPKVVVQAEEIKEVKEVAEPEVIEVIEVSFSEPSEVKQEVAAPIEDKVFSIRKTEFENTIKVIDKIDLSAINDATRPAKKTKEQKRKERIEKERQQQQVRKPVAPTAKSNNGVAPSAEKKVEKREKDEIFSTNVPKLKAPKLVDKIDLNTVPSSGSGYGNDRKKKRKRIGNERVNIDNHAAQGGVVAGNPANPANSKTKTNRRPTHVNVVSEEDVAKQVKETLARLTEGKKNSKKAARYRKDKREAAEQRIQEQAAQERRDSTVLKLTEFVTANELAAMMNVPVTNIIKTCLNIGLFVSINQRLDAETINIVADEFGFKTEFVSADLVHAITDDEEDKAEDIVSRSPIVTVMGHVDHGKTSLLDYIRKANVIAGEAGGITQHIGAYNVQLEDGRRITFLDTPGHEAFTAMRARGAKVTDIVIIIVAADDGVMPQTVEAINHASAAGVPIIFAINKVDKSSANPEKIKESLSAMNYLVEDWGGKYQSQDISAKKGTGVSELLEKVLLEAELLELKANPKRKASGSVIESSLDKGRGYVATLLIQNGTLHVGDVVLAGTAYGRIKAMFNERNQRIDHAGPAEPVIILGFNGAPQAGDAFNVFTAEHEAREIANTREQLQREQGLRTSRHLTLDEIGRRIALGSFQELNLIVKGDVDGSIEALSDSLIKLSTEEIQVNVIHKAVGQISESDIMLAVASNAIVIGFQVRPSLAARKMAEHEQIDIRLYSIIYDAIEEIKSAMEGMLSPDIKEEITATIEVRETFKITKVGTIAGCMVKEGKVKRNNKVRLIRDGIVIYSGELESLKRMKDDVKEVSSGYECGLNIANYNDVRIGDIIEAYEEIEVKKKLS